MIQEHEDQRGCYHLGSNVNLETQGCKNLNFLVKIVSMLLTILRC
jgi:hypothetical protein